VRRSALWTGRSLPLKGRAQPQGGHGAAFRTAPVGALPPRLGAHPPDGGRAPTTPDDGARLRGNSHQWEEHAMIFRTPPSGNQPFESRAQDESRRLENFLHNLQQFLRTAPSPSFVFAGLDPAIHDECPQMQPVRLCFAVRSHGCPGQARARQTRGSGQVRWL
jgi:hypothetical protein